VSTTFRSILVNAGRFIMILFAVIFSMGEINFAFARSAHRFVDEGNEAYENGLFDEAAALYEEARDKKPESAVPLLNLGISLYKQGNFSAALAAFQNIEKLDDEIAPQIHYNQGNALARMGEIEESENPQEALEYYRKSVAAYKRTLSMDPNHTESAYNMEVVRMWIRDLVGEFETVSGDNPGSDPSDEQQNEQRREASPGDRNEDQNDGQQEPNDEGDTPSTQSPEAPYVPQDNNIIPRDETAQAILREEQKRREAEARIRGGLSEDDRPTW
jgi:tetratricopeptide (TPR) repeat protein